MFTHTLICYGATMINTVKFSTLVFIIFLMYTFHCLKIIPERASLTYVNERYISNASLNVRRTSRGGEYVANLELILKVKVGYNASLDLIFYEYLHNEFRRSFVELHFNYCDLILRDPYFGKILRRAGLVQCPILPGKVSLRNASLNADIPSVWPFENGKVEFTATDDLAGAMIGKGEIVLTFKQNLPKFKN